VLEAPSEAAPIGPQSRKSQTNLGLWQGHRTVHKQANQTDYLKNNQSIIVFRYY